MKCVGLTLPGLWTLPGLCRSDPPRPMGMKFGDLIIASLYLYLIAYFRRKDVRQYFKTDGQILV